MAQQKQRISEFQKKLLDKMNNAPMHFDAVVFFKVGQRILFVDVLEINMFSPSTDVVPIPIAASWILGVANISGNVYIVNDFGLFLGEKKEKTSFHTKLLIPAKKYGVNSALMVSQIMYLRDFNFVKTFKKLDEKPSESYIKSIYELESYDIDKKVRTKTRVEELDMAALVNSKEFLNAGGIKTTEDK